MTPKEKYYKRRQWFLDRIGKRVFRKPNGCSCATCEKITKEGLIIADESHAIYMHDAECISNAENKHKFTYKD
jgi:hypothetical protein